MSKALSALQDFTGFLFSPAFQANLSTTTWVIIGAILFQTLSLLLTPRIAALLTFAGLFAKLVPTVLVTTGKTPNEALKTVIPGKTAVLFPNRDGSTGSPGGRGFALLILGVKISHPLGLFAPGAKETGEYFTSMVKDLNARKKENGYLGGGLNRGDHGLFLTGYFESMEALHGFAHAPMHREAWNWWNKNVKGMPHIGVYHEAYDIPANHWEAVYLQTPKIGLGQSKVFLENGEVGDVIADARKGVWRTSAGRMGRQEGKVHESDPYMDE